MQAAASRVATEELGIAIQVDRLLGVESHFWETSAVSKDISRHTVNTVFLVRFTRENPTIELDDQHTAYRFVDEPEPNHHEIVKRYFAEYDLFS